MATSCAGDSRWDPLLFLRERPQFFRFHEGDSSSAQSAHVFNQCYGQEMKINHLLFRFGSCSHFDDYGRLLFPKKTTDHPQSYASIRSRIYINELNELSFLSNKIKKKSLPTNQEHPLRSALLCGRLSNGVMCRSNCNQKNGRCLKEKNRFSLVSWLK